MRHYQLWIVPSASIWICRCIRGMRRTLEWPHSVVMYMYCAPAPVAFRCRRVETGDELLKGMGEEVRRLYAICAEGGERRCWRLFPRRQASRRGVRFVYTQQDLVSVAPPRQAKLQRVWPRALQWVTDRRDPSVVAATRLSIYVGETAQQWDVKNTYTPQATNWRFTAVRVSHGLPLIGQSLRTRTEPTAEHLLTYLLTCNRGPLWFFVTCEKILAFWWQHEQESSGCSGVFFIWDCGRLWLGVTGWLVDVALKRLIDKAVRLARLIRWQAMIWHEEKCALNARGLQNGTRQRHCKYAENSKFQACDYEISWKSLPVDLSQSCSAVSCRKDLDLCYVDLF